MQSPTHVFNIYFLPRTCAKIRGCILNHTEKETGLEEKHFHPGPSQERRPKKGLLGEILNQ